MATLTTEQERDKRQAMCEHKNYDRTAKMCRDCGFVIEQANQVKDLRALTGKVGKRV